MSQLVVAFLAFSAAIGFIFGLMMGSIFIEIIIWLYTKVFIFLSTLNEALTRKK